ncbi:hypothetical protein LOTGIDRAFT_169987 [Lottia gigantea]|uniref:Uncharacterized protein n=1 Tax=Lottia gigantea TaxID=225164 RepID=V4B275_LOTGI|nr:hypothetical protein LOTGIDRAFT_169987 [Lottia gigantea]ESO82369.1 hypothetical protein LOTGIDRAFT_169987 [Lottia gigantea]
MKIVFVFFLTVCVVYLTVGESDDDKLVDKTPEKRTDEKAEGVFSSENEANDFLKDKREPGSRKYYKYGRFMRMALPRKHHYGRYGGSHRYRYHGHHGGSSSEEEEGGYYGNRYGGGRYGGGGFDWDD